MKKMKYCQKCGNPNEDTAVFCNKCGTKFVQLETPQPQSLNQQHTQQSHEPLPKKKKWSRNKKIIVGCIVAFFLIVAIFGEDPALEPTTQSTSTDVSESSQIETTEPTTTTKAIDENIQNLIDATGYSEASCENIYNQLTGCGYTSVGKLTFLNEGTTTKSFKVTGDYYGSGTIIVEESGLYYFSWGSDTLYDAENPDVIKDISNYAILYNDRYSYFLPTENAIKNLLKSPSTADFPDWHDGWGLSVENGIVTVSSYVDAQNSFGAMLRSNFIAQYRISDGQGIYLEFDETVYIDER